MEPWSQEPSMGASNEVQGTLAPPLTPASAGRAGRTGSLRHGHSSGKADDPYELVRDVKVV